MATLIVKVVITAGLLMVSIALMATMTVLLMEVTIALLTVVTVLMVTIVRTIVRLVLTMKTGERLILPLRPTMAFRVMV